MTKSTLSLNGLGLPVFLGVYQGEQLNKQIVSCDLHFTFPTPPKGCETDQLEDTVCYAKLIEFINKNLGDRRFQLIEHLAKDLHEALLGYFDNKIKVLVKITKFVFPGELAGGASFEYGHD